MEGVKYKSEIIALFDFLLDDSMSDDEKEECVSHILGLVGKSIADLSNEIETGSRNGVSPKVQLSITKSILMKGMSHEPRNI